jgi:Ser/Thr protein kinase RdoA (MazF antagonist)
LWYAVTYFDQERQVSAHKVIIGKGYYRDDGAMTFHAMSQLWSDGFAAGHLTIPEPLAYVLELSLLLQGRAPGKSLYLSLDNPANALKLVRLTARWLAKLHQTRVAGVPVLQPEQEDEKISTYRNALLETCPRFAPRLKVLAGRILSSFKRLRASQSVPTHGDFQPKNIHILRNRVTVIDFDRFALAPPARDLGHFIGQCMTMSYVRTGSFQAIEPWNTAFLEEYVGLTSLEVLAALPVFVARTFLEVLYYKLVVRPVKDPYFLPAWLDECERWLEST